VLEPPSLETSLEKGIVRRTVTVDGVELPTLEKVGVRWEVSAADVEMAPVGNDVRLNVDSGLKHSSA
jgi:hypothetical protein